MAPAEVETPEVDRVGPGTGAADRGRGVLPAWLTVFWPAAILFHLAANPHHLLVLDGVGVAQLGLIAVAAAVILQPSVLVLRGLAGLWLAVFWAKLPVVGNHEVLLALMAVGVVAAGRVGTDPSRWSHRIASAWRAGLLVGYGFLALSKLNHGFFDPAVSCAAVLGAEVGDLVGLVPEGSVSIRAVAWATALVEVAIPVLLAVRRWRAVGVVVALAFHFVLAVHPVTHIWDFSSTLLVLFLLFLPARGHQHLDARVAVWRTRPIGERGLGLALVLALQTVALAGPLPGWLPAYPLWLLVGGATLALAVSELVDRWAGAGIDSTPRERSGRGHPITVATVVVAGLALLNGLAPYAEVRSAAGFNMYSNLRVIDGESNHWFLPALPIWSRGPLVEPGPDPELDHYRSAGLVVPVENLDRHQGRRPGWRATLAHKVAFRRAVAVDRPDRCLRAWGPIG